MDLENAHPGYPFEGDYRLYGQPQENSQQLFHGHTRDLEQRQSDLGRRRSIMERLTTLREEGGYRRVGYMCRDDAPDVLFAADEIVTSTTAFTEPTVGRGLRRLGFEPPIEVGARLPEQVMRLQWGDRQRRRDTLEYDRIPDELAGAIEFLRRQGHPASVNYVMAQAQGIPSAVGKAEGDPVPVVDNLPPPFAQYAAMFPPATVPITVAVIDGGVAAAARTDGWLGSVPLTSTNIDPIDVVPSDGHRDAMAGHGERVLGVVQQVAPYASVRMYRVADTLGFALDSDIATAIQQAVQDGARIINISLAGQVLPTMPPLATTAAIAQIRQQHGENVAIVAAAGNFANTDLTFPAADPYVVSVAGLTSQLQPTGWSTRGWVTMSTGGEGILSTFVEDQYPPQGVVPEPWARSTGTSFAAPQIAGAVARICYERGLTPGAAVAELIRVGVPVPDFGTAVQVLPGLP